VTASVPVVVDTDVFSRVVMTAPTGPYLKYRTLLDGRPLLLAAQTVAEMRAGALIRQWGPTRVAAMEARIDRFAVVPVNEWMTRHWAELKAACRSAGHALGDKHHDGDRWVAATAHYLRLPLASNDGIYVKAPGVDLLV